MTSPKSHTPYRWRQCSPTAIILVGVTWLLVACAPVRQPDLPPPADLSLEALFGDADEVDNSPLLAEARAQLGVPYRPGGATPEGFDCSGLTQYVYGLTGVAIPRQADAQFRQAQPVDEPHPGDLLFFRDPDGDAISHVAILASGPLFIHAPRDGRGVCYDSLESPYWRQRFYGAGRYR